MKPSPASPSNLSNSAIEAYVEKIANAHQLPSDSPRDVVDFARNLGGEIEYADGAESLHVFDKGKFTIRVPYYTSTARDRFTIAHELGHYFLHYRLPELSGEQGFGRGDRNRAETEANVFASCLLMPRELFSSTWNRFECNAWRVARYFGVSPAAATVRADVLGLPKSQGD